MADEEVKRLTAELAEARRQRDEARQEAERMRDLRDTAKRYRRFLGVSSHRSTPDGPIEEAEADFICAVDALLSTPEPTDEHRTTTLTVRAVLAKAAREARQEAERHQAVIKRSQGAARRLTTLLIANASRLDVPFTNAEGSPWSLHIAPAIARLRDALGIVTSWPPPMSTPEPETARRPSPADLWQQAKGDRDEYRRLMRHHGHLIDAKPGEDPNLPCGWPGRRVADDAVSSDGQI